MIPSPLSRLAWLVPLLAATALLGACRQTGSAQARDAEAPHAAPADAAAQTALPDFRWLVKKYGGAVVNVNVVSRLHGEGSEEDALSDFLRRFGIPVPGAPDGPGSGPGGPDGSSGPVLRGLGSGFIVSADGYVITNAHVVASAADVTVKLPDRREFPAKVIGLDERSDVAVLKIDGHDLPTVRLGDPSRVEAGEWVAAIGAPFGFENSVTVGVVSATARALGPQSSFVPFIQTDVAVNPGNSGGPLFNLRGEVIGVNSQIYSATGGYQGISFAIPIDVAMNVERQLIETGHVTRGRIGVAIQDVNSQLAQSFGLDRPRGALISSVEPGSPAASAGLRPGDIILSVDDKPIETSTELPSLIANTRPGTETHFQIWRERKEQKVNVRVGEMKDESSEPPRSRGGSARPPTGDQEPRLGLGVRPLTPAERQAAETQGGVLVEHVEGPAATAGLQPGDIILGVGDAPVRNVQDLRKAVQKAKGSVALLVQREGAQIYVPVRLQ